MASSSCSCCSCCSCPFLSWLLVWPLAVGVACRFSVLALGLALGFSVLAFVLAFGFWLLFWLRCWPLCWLLCWLLFWLLFWLSRLASLLASLLAPLYFACGFSAVESWLQLFFRQRPTCSHSVPQILLGKQRRAGELGTTRVEEESCIESQQVNRMIPNNASPCVAAPGACV